jgi:serine protease Do
VEDLFDLRVAVANTPPGQRVPVVVVRNGELVESQIELAERTLEQHQRDSSSSRSFDQREEPAEQPKEIGLEFRTLTARDARQLGLEGEEGALITEVIPGSLADDAGLRPQMVVTEVNGRSISSAEDFEEIVLSLASQEGVVLRVVAGGQGINKSVAYTSFVKP